MTEPQAVAIAAEHNCLMSIINGLTWAVPNNKVFIIERGWSYNFVTRKELEKMWPADFVAALP
jgi:hypothetical protein